MENENSVVEVEQRSVEYMSKRYVQWAWKSKNTSKQLKASAHWRKAIAKRMLSRKELMILLFCAC